MAVLLTVPLLEPKTKLSSLGTNFIFVAFFFTIILFFVKNTALKYGLTVITFLLSYSMHFEKREQLIVWVTIMLPTIIHVFVFTGLFILYGALKSRSASGILSLFVFIGCALSFFIFIPPHAPASISPYVENSSNLFSIINKSLLYIFNLDGVNSFSKMLGYPKTSIFTSPKAIVVARFIAFAYTYHYLNWFSKTTVIKWHNVSKYRLIIIGLLWLISVILYVLDYSMGFKILFLLSMLHVFFEFPLNLQTIKGIGSELGKRISNK